MILEVNVDAAMLDSIVGALQWHNKEYSHPIRRRLSRQEPKERNAKATIKRCPTRNREELDRPKPTLGKFRERQRKPTDSMTKKGLETDSSTIPSDKANVLNFL